MYRVAYETAHDWLRILFSQKEAAVIQRNELLALAQESMRKRTTNQAREAGYIFHHGQRVAALAVNLQQHLGGAEIGDPEILFAAGLFHDVGKGIGEHAETGAHLVKNLLRECCTPVEYSQIAFLIYQHNKRNQPSLPLAAHILQDADMLDHFGAQNIWLHCLGSTVKHLSPREMLKQYHGEEYRRLLQTCRDSLNLDVSRQAYDSRLAFEASFMHRFAEELDGML